MTESGTYRAAHVAASVVHEDMTWVPQTAEDSTGELGRTWDIGRAGAWGPWDSF